MKHTENQHRLHTAALNALDSIQRCRATIKECQDKMVDIEKNIILNRPVKSVLLDSYEASLLGMRETKQGWVDHYANLMQQLCETYITQTV